MYSVFLFCSSLATSRCCDALERGAGALGARGALPSLADGRGAPVRRAGARRARRPTSSSRARERLQEAIARRRRASLVLGIPFWLTDLVLAGRFDVGVGGGGEKLGGPGAVARYLWRTAGDFTAGWWPVALPSLAAAGVGFVDLRRRGARCSCSARSASPAAAFVARAARRLGLARVEAPDLPRAASSPSPSPRARPPRPPAPPVAAVAVAPLLVARGRVGVAAHARRSSNGSPTRGRRRGPRPRPGSRRRAGATTCSSATSRSISARGSGTGRCPRRSCRVPTRASRSATLERRRAARPRRLGARRERAEQHPAGLEIERRLPEPADGVRGAGVRAVPRPPDEGADHHARGVPLLRRARAPRRPVARDRRRRRQHPHRRARGARPARLRPVAALSLEQLAVAGRALERLRAPSVPGGARRRRARRSAAATADAPTSPPRTKERTRARRPRASPARRHGPCDDRTRCGSSPSVISCSTWSCGLDARARPRRGHAGPDLRLGRRAGSERRRLGRRARGRGAVARQAGDRPGGPPGGGASRRTTASSCVARSSPTRNGVVVSLAQRDGARSMFPDRGVAAIFAPDELRPRVARLRPPPRLGVRAARRAGRERRAPGGRARPRGGRPGQRRSLVLEHDRGGRSVERSASS